MLLFWHKLINYIEQNLQLSEVPQRTTRQPNKNLSPPHREISRLTTTPNGRKRRPTRHLNIVTQQT